MEISLEGGQVKAVTINLGTDSRQDLSLWARWRPAQEPQSPAWPGKDLKVEISRDIPYRAEGRKLELKVTAEHSCPAGDYRGVITVGSGGSGSVRGGRVEIPVIVQVTASGAYQAGEIFVAALILAAVVLWLYTRGMYFNCSFLTPDQLAGRILPVRWTSQNQPNGAPEKRGEVRARIEEQFVRSRRFWAWLRANPLVFGLPWKRYAETVRLDLGRRHDDIVLEFMPYRDSFEHYQANPESARGQLFASATPGKVAFIFGFADKGGSIGKLQSDPPIEKLARIRPGTRLLARPFNSLGTEDLSGVAAGWQILG